MDIISDEFGKATFSVPNSGSYLVTSGIDALQLNSESVTGIKGLNSNIKYRIYPNPFSGKFRIESEFPINEIEIYNLQGQMVLKHNDALPVVDFSSFPSGIYILWGRVENQVFQQKIVKN